MRLLRDVRFDDLIGDVAAAATEVASCPDMTPPKPLPQVRKLGQEAIGAFPFHPLDQTTDGHVRWDGHHDMDMVRRDMSLEDIHQEHSVILTPFEAAVLPAEAG